MSTEPATDAISADARIVDTNAPLEAIERAQIDMQIATAHRYPRTLSKVKDDMLSFATLDEETAASCFYTLPRGGKTIQGPSVRLAEIAISCYGNLRAGSRVIGTVTSGDNPHVVIQSVAHDLEKNVAITIEKRRRITKKKNKDKIDEDDINLAVNAGAAIALRDAVFKVVPLALIKPVYEQAKLVAIGKATSLAEKRGKILDRLKQMGAQLPNILGVVEARTIEDIDAERLGILIGLGTALKEGETTIEEAFPAPKADGGGSIAGALGEKPKEKSEARGAETKTETKAPEKAAAEEGPAVTEAEFKTMVTTVENFAINTAQSESKLIKWAKENGHTVPKGADAFKALPYATLVAIKTHCEAVAKG